VDRDEHIQYFDLHQEAERFLLVAEAAKTTVRSSTTTRHLVEIAYA
jgi:hypothetical protein